MKKEQFEETLPEGQENLPSHVYNLSNTTHIERVRFFERVVEKLDEAEKEVLALMLQGEKSNDKFSAIIERYSSVSDSAYDVKNFKDRLKRKVRTIAEELGYDKRDLLDD
jgi:hypothetical protein